MKAVLAALLLGSLALATSRAAAQCQDEACVRTASQVASVNTQQSALLDATLNSLLGTGNSVDLTAADDTALANTNVKLGGLTNALNAAGVGTDATSALNTSTSLATVLQAASTTVRAQGNVSAADALDKLRAQTASVNAGGIKVGDLVSVDTRSGPLGKAELNLLDLVSGSASVFNSKNVASVNQVSLTGAQLGLPSSIGSVQLAMVVVEPALFVCGPVGTQFYSANTRVRARISLTGTGLDLSLPPLSSARLSLLTFDLVAAVGRASGTIQALDATASTLTVSATPGVAELYLGTISDANFADRTTPIDPASELAPAQIGSLTLSLLGINAGASVNARSYAKGVSPTAKTLSFTGPYEQTLTATTQSGFAAALVDSLLSNLTVNVGPITPSLGLPPATLSTLTNTILGTVTGALTGTSSILGPPLTSATQGAIDPLLAQLGIKLGEVSVTAEKPYKVSAGSACNDLNFCTDNDLCGANGVCAGTPKTCSDGLDCTTDVCSAATGSCSNTIGAGSCVIDSACFAAGASDPSNDCRACVPTSSTTSWTARALGVACNDGLFCTAGDACNGLGTCTALPRLCDDGLLCTVETCDETLDRCSAAISAGCVVDGACVLPGTDDPSNACRSCNPLLSTTSYSNKASGAQCADGLFCTTGDACDGQGSCASSARNCEDGISCTSNACDEASDQCTSSVLDGCLILGACLAAGSDNPLNSCQSCNPASSTSSWSLKGTGASCSDGLFCTAIDTCNALGICTGTPRVCDPSGVGCASVCDEVQDLCRTDIGGCLIGSACVAPGTEDPLNPCRSCVPAVSTVAYTNKASGSPCSDGLYCTTGDVCSPAGLCTGAARNCADNLSCTTDVCDELNDSCGSTLTAGGGGCVIGGACIASEAVDPQNACQSCQPALSTTAYSARAAGSACDDGQFCSTGDVCNGEGACVGKARDCNGGAAGCASTCDELLDVCRTGLSSCVIDGTCVAAGTVDPGNPCRECNPLLGPARWTNKLVGSSCDDGLYCTTGDVCSLTGSCGGTTRSCGGAPGSCSITCDETRDACTAGLSGCNIAGVCLAAGAVDPNNPCQVCNPTLSTIAFSLLGAGAACSDGLFCTTNDKCNAIGVCLGATTSCSDDLDCTADFCDETADRCSSTISSGCVMGGECIAAGASDPANSCRSCNPAVSTSSFSNKPAAVACDDGRFCTVSDGCDGQGGCGGTFRSCSSGAAGCTSFCDEATDLCRSDVVGCTINETCVAPGTDDPNNSCRTCSPASSTRDFSAKSAGAACSDGLFCTGGDQCNALGVCVGGAESCSDGQSCTLDTCDESADTCKHTSTLSCVVDGACVAAGSSPVGQPCKVCDPLQSTSRWSNTPAGIQCSDGLYCTALDQCDGQGACMGGGTRCPSDGLGCTVETCDETSDSCVYAAALGCVIGHQCWDTGTVSTVDACLVCDPAQSTSAFTYAPKSAGCDSDRDGLLDGFEQNPDGTPIETDHDGNPNHFDVDDDGDTQATKNEAPDADRNGAPNDARDFDGDGVADYLDADDDGDTRDTLVEIDDPEDFGYTDDVDDDGILSWFDLDSDGDGASDAAENAGDGDLNDDLIPDYLQKEVVPVDDDGDGIPSAVECADKIDACVDSDGDGKPDHLDTDDDNDGVATKYELASAGAPTKNTNKPDLSIPPSAQDQNTIDDHLDSDDDGDTVPTKDENADPNGDGNPSDARDLDADGIPDYLDYDDDGDDIPTKQEVTDGLAYGEDLDIDSIPNWYDSDSDGDGIPDMTEDPGNSGGDANGNGIPDYLEGSDDDDAGIRDGGARDASLRDAARDARSTEAGPLPAAEDASTGRKGGISGGALCSTSAGAAASGSGAWMLILIMGGLRWRRRQR